MSKPTFEDNYVCTQHFYADNNSKYINQLDRQIIANSQRYFLKSGGIDIYLQNEKKDFLWSKTAVRKRALHYELHTEFLYYTKPSEIYEDMRRYR